MDVFQKKPHHIRKIEMGMERYNLNIKLSVLVEEKLSGVGVHLPFILVMLHSHDRLGECLLKIKAPILFAGHSLR